jgi:hypothetical protein
MVPGSWFLGRVAEVASGDKIPLADLLGASAVIGAVACVAATGFERLPGWLCRGSNGLSPQKSSWNATSPFTATW